MSTLEIEKEEVPCHIEYDKYANWTRALQSPYQNPRFRDTQDFVQNCRIRKIAPRKRGDVGRCPVMVRADCHLKDSYRQGLKCPFSRDGATNEECECLGLPTTAKTLPKKNEEFICTCMHDYKKTLGDEKKRKEDAQVNQCDENYAFRKKCKVTKQLSYPKFNADCTILNCHYKLEEEYFKIKHQSPQCSETNRDYLIVVNKTEKKTATTKPVIPIITTTLQETTTTKTTPKLTTTTPSTTTPKPTTTTTTSTTTPKPTTSTTTSTTTIKTTPVITTTETTTPASTTLETTSTAKTTTESTTSLQTTTTATTTITSPSTTPKITSTVKTTSDTTTPIQTTTTATTSASTTPETTSTTAKTTEESTTSLQTTTTSTSTTPKTTSTVKTTPDTTTSDTTIPDTTIPDTTTPTQTTTTTATTSASTTSEAISTAKTTKDSTTSLQTTTTSTTASTSTIPEAISTVKTTPQQTTTTFTTKIVSITPEITSTSKKLPDTTTLLQTTTTSAVKTTPLQTTTTSTNIAESTTPEITSTAKALPDKTTLLQTTATTRSTTPKTTSAYKTIPETTASQQTTSTSTSVATSAITERTSTAKKLPDTTNPTDTTLHQTDSTSVKTETDPVRTAAEYISTAKTSQQTTTAAKTQTTSTTGTITSDATTNKSVTSPQTPDRTNAITKTISAEKAKLETTIIPGKTSSQTSFAKVNETAEESSPSEITALPQTTRITKTTSEISSTNTRALDTTTSPISTSRKNTINTSVVHKPESTSKIMQESTFRSSAELKTPISTTTTAQQTSANVKTTPQQSIATSPTTIQKNTSTVPRTIAKRTSEKTNTDSYSTTKAPELTTTTTENSRATKTSIPPAEEVKLHTTEINDTYAEQQSIDISQTNITTSQTQLPLDKSVTSAYKRTGESTSNINTNISTTTETKQPTTKQIPESTKIIKATIKTSTIEHPSVKAETSEMDRTSMPTIPKVEPTVIQAVHSTESQQDTYTTQYPTRTSQVSQRFTRSVPHITENMFKSSEVPEKETGTSPKSNVSTIINGHVTSKETPSTASVTQQPIKDKTVSAFQTLLPTISTTNHSTNNTSLIYESLQNSHNPSIAADVLTQTTIPFKSSSQSTTNSTMGSSNPIAKQLKQNVNYTTVMFLDSSEMSSTTKTPIADSLIISNTSGNKSETTTVKHKDQKVTNTELNASTKSAGVSLSNNNVASSISGKGITTLSSSGTTEEISTSNKSLLKSSTTTEKVKHTQGNSKSSTIPTTYSQDTTISHNENDTFNTAANTSIYNSITSSVSREDIREIQETNIPEKMSTSSPSFNKLSTSEGNVKSTDTNTESLSTSSTSPQHISVLHGTNGTSAIPLYSDTTTFSSSKNISMPNPYQETNLVNQSNAGTTEYDFAFTGQEENETTSTTYSDASKRTTFTENSVSDNADSNPSSKPVTQKSIIIERIPSQTSNILLSTLPNIGISTKDHRIYSSNEQMKEVTEYQIAGTTTSKKSSRRTSSTPKTAEDLKLVKIGINNSDNNTSNTLLFTFSPTNHNGGLKLLKHNSHSGSNSVEDGPLLGKLILSPQKSELSQNTNSQILPLYYVLPIILVVMSTCFVLAFLKKKKKKHAKPSYVLYDRNLSRRRTIHIDMSGASKDMLKKDNSFSNSDSDIDSNSDSESQSNTDTNSASDLETET